MADKGTEQKGKKVSLFKQKMQLQKEETAKLNPTAKINNNEAVRINLFYIQQQNISNQNDKENIKTNLAFPESVKLSNQEIQNNLQQIEEEELIKQKELNDKKNSKLFVNPQEYEQISKENEDLLKSMNQDEISNLQKQLYEILDPGVLSRFKKRDLFQVNEHPSAINEYKQDAYGLSVEKFIKNNSEEIKKVYNIEVKTPQDAIKQACFDKNGKLLIKQTTDDKFKNSENLELESLDCFNLETLNKLIDNSNRNYNSLAIEVLERIIMNINNSVNTQNKGDFIFEISNIKVYRLDFIYYLESVLSLAYTLCRCLYVPNMTLNLNTLSCLRAYLEFILQDELKYYKQFLMKLQHSESQKKKFKAITQIIIDENLLRQVSYLINNLLLAEKSEKFFSMIVDILESLLYIDYDFFTKRIQDFGFIEQIRSIGGKQMEDKLEFLKFELGKLDYVYENIPLTLQTLRLIREAKSSISNITLEKYQQSLDQQLKEYKQINEKEATKSEKENKLRSIRDLLIFGEKINLLKKANIDKSQFIFNSSVLDNTILMILELNNDKEEEGYTLPKEKTELKYFLFDQVEENKMNFTNSYTKEDISYLIEGLIHSEGKGVPHCFKNIIDRIIPLDIQIMFKYHYQLKEKKSYRIANHFMSFKQFIKLFISLYTELNFQMKYIILKKTRKALSVRNLFNECFSDILRVIIIEFVEFFTLASQENMPELTQQQIQLSLSFISLLSEIKQTEAFISVLNIIKQVSNKNTTHPSLKKFDVFSNFFISLKAKKNEGRQQERLRDLIIFLENVDVFCSYIQNDPDNLFFYHTELFFLRIINIFDDKQAAFTQIDEKSLDKLFTAVCNYVDVNKMSILFDKNSDIPQKIVTNFNYNSYGNAVFTRLVFFIVQKPFELKMKKKVLIDTVLSYAFLFSENCKEKVYGKESNYLKRVNRKEDSLIKLKRECEHIEKFLALNEIDTTSRSSVFNKFLHSYIQNEE